MDERIEKQLYDIKFSIEEIESYFEAKDIKFSDYQKNSMLKRATERNLEIVGEAMNRILKRDDSFAEKISELKAIIGLRNQVIHSYDNISDENIWSIIINHIPQLKSQVNSLLDN